MPEFMANLKWHNAKGLGKFTVHMHKHGFDARAPPEHHSANHHNNSCTISPVRNEKIKVKACSSYNETKSSIYN